MRSILIIFFGIQVLFYFSCTNDPGFSENPEIEFISFSKDTLIQNNLNTDSLLLTIAFKDGDADLGGDNPSVNQNIIITDKRTDVVYDRFKIPDLGITGIQTGIEGEIILKVFTTCCIFPDNIPPCSNPSQYPTNELSFEIEMFDDNGNKSNTIETGVIVLLCE